MLEGVQDVWCYFTWRVMFHSCFSAKNWRIRDSPLSMKNMDYETTVFFSYNMTIKSNDRILGKRPGKMVVFKTTKKTVVWGCRYACVRHNPPFRRHEDIFRMILEVKSEDRRRSNRFQSPPANNSMNIVIYIIDRNLRGPPLKTSLK